MLIMKCLTHPFLTLLSTHRPLHTTLPHIFLRFYTFLRLSHHFYPLPSLSSFPYSTFTLIISTSLHHSHPFHPLPSLSITLIIFILYYLSPSLSSFPSSTTSLHHSHRCFRCHGEHGSPPFGVLYDIHLSHGMLCDTSLLPFDNKQNHKRQKIQ